MREDTRVLVDSLLSVYLAERAAEFPLYTPLSGATELPTEHRQCNERIAGFPQHSSLSGATELLTEFPLYTPPSRAT
jgi:hypothetical protein